MDRAHELLRRWMDDDVDLEQLTADTRAYLAQCSCAPAAEPVAPPACDHDWRDRRTSDDPHALDTCCRCGAVRGEDEPVAPQPEAPTLADDDSPANGMATDNNIASHTNLSTDDFARELRLLPIYRMLAREIAVWTERAAARIESDAKRIRELEAEVRLLATPHHATLLLYGDCERDLAASRERIRELEADMRDALLLAWGGVCPSGWVMLGTPQEVAEQIRRAGDELQSDLALLFAERDALAERADALHKALRWANGHVPGQVACDDCGYIAGGHAEGCGYAALLAAPSAPTDAP